MMVPADTQIIVLNRIDATRHAMLKAGCLWEEGNEKDSAPIWSLDYTVWQRVLSEQCGFDNNSHKLRYHFELPGGQQTGYAYCEVQWLCAIQLMLQDSEQTVQFEIIPK
ncbi:hypothetical protein BDV28DRAFT_146967 [Aspergillus coremiiformis]|uniref:Uncharacterized protein n=1 Tax=Aspergillus coremiiformis TaxID=138285 RepID=A0A5N6ZEU3_9EURO|nr:hypothetical protein BDV28DRAFT_146967 [Aspergillus coremiiformis]